MLGVLLSQIVPMLTDVNHITGFLYIKAGISIVLHVVTIIVLSTNK